MKRENAVNKYLAQKDEIGEEQIVFYLKEDGTWVHYEASEYKILERILNAVDIAHKMMWDIDIDQTMELEIYKKWMENIHDIVQEIYEKSVNHD